MMRRLLRPFKPRLPRPILAPIRAASKKTSPPPEPAISHGSDNHNDLPSFLAYAARANLAADRTVYVGTHYEYTVAATLRRLGFHLTRTGRVSDFGIDLLGTWRLPIPKTRGSKKAAAVDDDTRDTPLRVLVQCKASNKTLNPKNVRELEGAFTGAPAQWREEDFLGLLATTMKATKGVMEALGRSRWPMGFLKVDPDGRVEQFLWNASAKARGLEGLGVTLRYMVDERSENGEVKSDIALTWQGRPLPYVELTEEAEALPALQMKSADKVVEQEEGASEPASENVEGKPEKKKRKTKASKTNSESVEEKPEKKEKEGASETTSEDVEEKPKKRKTRKTSETPSEDVEEKPEKKKPGRPRKKDAEPEA
ncbi:endonuclease resolvase hjc trna endonuclease [Diplodia corticola]|uniref:Endonuclease resolvase hjc trna endonuclease n=1 Tax=Diplodia corticola TaxID=236234 RepID=A0A1J9QVY8_9PEZI|nr:endonuclease resolvase hjc trna endonuclease [Diplodia corticola]OJD32162.1 endonuclease resolvase hjc trna endonuclease [Diplodia corticola]